MTLGVTEQLQLERTLKDHQVQLPALKLSPVAEGMVREVHTLQIAHVVLKTLLSF